MSRSHDTILPLAAASALIKVIQRGLGDLSPASERLDALVAGFLQTNTGSIYHFFLRFLLRICHKSFSGYLAT